MTTDRHAAPARTEPGTAPAPASSAPTRRAGPPVAAVLLAAATAVLVARDAPAQTTKTHAGKPITTDPCPSPEDARKKMKVPDGFEVRLFAAEPDVVNPVAMTFDTRGRLWVLEMYEYPLGVAKGKTGRDRIIILEDTDGDGRADKRTVWFEGLNMPCGIAYGSFRGRAGVFLSSMPDVLFIAEKADGTADKPLVVRTGLGAQDTHELLNGFTWGPDGRLYMTHGVFTHSYAKDPSDPDDDGVRFNAAVMRFDPRNNRFEQFADGMSNQWGVDFNAEGQAFVSACVIDHLFHVAAGGIYVRQAGTPGFAYAYELLRSIVKHKHQKAAYCYIACLQNGHWPAEYQQTLVMGNIHGHCINRDRPERKGSTYFATDTGDFLTANDGWFMPVNLQSGPDGELWVADWCDRYPCYQNARADPAGVDREKGRIWRVVYVGKDAGKPVRPVPADLGDLAGRTDEQLTALLASDNVWQRRTALRLLGERGTAERGTAVKLMPLVTDGKAPEAARLAALGATHAAGEVSDFHLVALTNPVSTPVSLRAFTARVVADGGNKNVSAGVQFLAKLAADPDALVRREVAHAARKLALAGTDVTEVVVTLAAQPATAEDAMLPFFVWMAAEPGVAKDAKPLLAALLKVEADDAATGDLVRRAMRRLCDTGKPERLDEAVGFLEALPLSRLTAGRKAFEGLLEGMKGKKIVPVKSPADALAKWRQTPHNGFGGAATQLGSAWGDTAATAGLLAVINDPAATPIDRMAGIRTARQVKGDAARKALLTAVAAEKGEAVLLELVGALGEVGGDGIAEALLARWGDVPASVRSAAADVLASRPAWAGVLVDAVAAKKVDRSQLPLSAIRTLSTLDDAKLKERVASVIGRYKPGGAEVLAKIAERRAVALAGPADFKVGEAMFAKHCGVCHKLHGKGAEVGPDLTGVGRSSLDALLSNMLNPNEVIGKGYEQVIVRTTDERVVAGRLVEDTAAHVKLLLAGPKEELIARADIEALKVTDLSVMPDGVEKQMTDAEFRSLVWYVLAHPADADKKLRLELQDKRIAVIARSAHAGEPVELLAGVLDPALRPYLHPVRDPSGTHVLTDDRPSDHVWQHGVFTGLHKVGAAGVDFWSEKTGKQRFVRLLDARQGSDRVGWRTLTEWVAPGGEVLLEEEQDVTVHAGETPAAYVIDVDWTLRSRGAAVPIGRYDYGGLSVRLQLHPRHDHLNSAGLTGKATNTKAAAWCNVSRPVGDGHAGIAVISHPGNFRHPPQWRVDGQGMISPSPSIGGDWGLRAKESITFRYRLVVHAGKGDAALLNRELEKLSALPAGITPESLRGGGGVRPDTKPAGQPAVKGVGSAASLGPGKPVGDPSVVTAWLAGWTLANPEFEGSPQVIAEHRGRKSVLVTHPVADRKTPAVLERTLDVPAGKKTTLSFGAASGKYGDWELRVVAVDGKEERVLLKSVIDSNKDAEWTAVSVDLSAYAGRGIRVRLENRAGGTNAWAWEFGYWADLAVKSE